MDGNEELSWDEGRAKLPDEKIRALRDHWKKYVSEDKNFEMSEIGQDKGIVITAGGLKYFTSAWVLISSLRALGCVLPIEVWFYGNEISKGMRLQLKKLGVKCCDMRRYVDTKPHGFLMKPLAILYCQFRHVLFLDADNVCVRDPTYLFEDKDYKAFGCLFWPDYWQTSKLNPIWAILELDFRNGYEQDSGQILVDKLKCWKQLQLCAYFNINGEEYYNFLYGDKDTFRFAWMALGAAYHMLRHDVGSCGYTDASNAFYGHTMVQHDSDGKVLFLHRNLLKWDITLKGEFSWLQIKRFAKNALSKQCHLRYSPKNHMSIDLTGDTYETPFDDILPGFESKCLEILNKLRSSNFYKNELQVYYLMKNRFS